MGRLIDITGERFNRLTVLERAHVDKDNFINWKCKCECGNIVYARAYHLKKGNIKSCGCLNNENRKKGIHNLSKEPIYAVWKSMKSRCYRSTDKRYSRYGGRGIRICDKWLNDPVSFIDWSHKNGYERGLTIDRKNNDGDYHPYNCRFVTTKINNQNSSNAKVNISIVNEIRNRYRIENIRQSDLAVEYGLTQQTISKIINNKTWNNE